MALNEKPCRDCKFYDRIILGDDSTKTNQGWCAEKSVYHASEQPGQVFPPNVKRAAPGELAKPYIVRGMTVVNNCLDFRSKK